MSNDSFRNRPAPNINQTDSVQDRIKMVDSLVGIIPCDVTLEEALEDRWTHLSADTHQPPTPEKEILS